jgi:NhaA family Na+:H+ antiporter
VVLPLFALANAGVSIQAIDPLNTVTLGVIAGLVLGKPLGIVLFAWMAVGAGVARKPDDVGWGQVLGAGMLAGIGFTMALFIANLAFAGAALEAAKLGILVASLIAGVAGMAMLLLITAGKSRDASAR